MQSSWIHKTLAW